MTHFDLAIIGSGSGNSIIADPLTGWNIALIEGSTFGGTCLNVGCIPTKMFVHTADIAESITGSSRYGIDATLDKVRWGEIRNRVFGRIDPVSAGGRMHRQESENVTLFQAYAEFDGDRSLRLSTGEHMTADHLVVATGSRAVIPPVVAGSGVNFHTSDTIMRIAHLPDRLAILGGGYIAAEFAHIFSALGVDVTLVVRGSGLLTQLDEEISRRFTALAKGRWDVRLGTELTGVHSTTAGGVRLDLARAAGTSTFDADVLLVAAGRTPNSDRLHLDRAGIDVGKGGLIEVDEYQRTTAPGVWAMGDVSSAHQLKHVANQDARVIAHNLAHPHALKASNHVAIPAAVFTEPQIASVGLTEQAARQRNVTYVSTVQEYSTTAYGWALEDSTSVCKLLADPLSTRLLGAHIMGPQAALLIQPLIGAIAFGQSVSELAGEQYWIHPALSEVVENALLSLELIQPNLPA